MNTQAILLLLLFALSGSISFADLVSDDHDYRVHPVAGFKIVYSEEYESLIPELQSYIRWFQSKYQKEFAWELDQETLIVLASSKNQIPNAFAAPFPRLYSTFYNGSAQFLEEFAAKSWLYSLVTHEMIHLYQVNTKGSWGKSLHAVFGNSAPALVPVPPFTYTMYPHVFTPTFIMEGNATFNEGRFGNGGRLHSGLYRALFLQLLKAEEINAARLMNDHLQWPYGTEKYIVGGYLQSHLAEKFGVERTNRFFINHAQKEFFPFRIDASFKETFGQGYNESINQLNKKYTPLVKAQKESSGGVVATSQEHVGFTRVEGNPSFMRSNFKDELEVCQWKAQSAELCCESVRLPFGRVFKFDGEWASASYQRVGPTLFQAGLFTAGIKPIESFRNKYVFDMTKNEILYAKTTESFRNVQLYKNEEKIGETQSAPYLSTAGDVYFFRQDEKGRHLYRNAAYVTSIDGFYGQVVDVSATDQIYFIANSNSGSALYVYDKGVTLRAHPSDLVVDAKLVGTESALISEITSRGYRYSIVQLQSSQGTPVAYTYDYEDPSDSSVFSPEHVIDATITTKNDKKYRPFSEIEFTGVDTSLSYFSDSGFNGFLNFRFSDPLQRYLTELQIRDSGWSSPGTRLQFISLKDRLNWLFAVDYEKAAYLRTLSSGETELLGHSTELQGLFGLIYPIQRGSLSANTLGLYYIHEVENADDQSVKDRVDETPLNKGVFSYDYKYAFSPGPLSYDPHTEVMASVDLKYQGEGSAWKPGAMVYSAEVGVSQNLGWDFFLTPSYKAALAEGELPAIELNDDAFASALDPTEFNAIGSVATKNYFELRRVMLELKRPFHFEIYHAVFPIGLRRFAPLAGYSEYYGSEDKSQAAETLFHQTYFGLEAEILFLHKFPARIKYIEVQKGEAKTEQVILGIHRQF